MGERRSDEQKKPGPPRQRMIEGVYSVYALVDPRTQATRYIGHTKCTWARLEVHISQARVGRDTTVKGDWIRELLALGLQPILTIIASDPDKTTVLVWERQWITRLAGIDPPLLNSCGLTPVPLEGDPRTIRYGR